MTRPRGRRVKRLGAVLQSRAVSRLGIVLRSLSAVVCLFLIFLWGRSTTGHDVPSYMWCPRDHFEHEICLCSAEGSVGVRLLSGTTVAAAGYSEWSLGLAENHHIQTLPPGVAGFRLSRKLVTASAGTWMITYVMIPHALLVGLTALPPATALLRLWRQQGRLMRGLCPSCGYDTRATGGHCPECGPWRQPSRPL